MVCKEKWLSLGWPRDYQRLVFAPVEKLKAQGRDYEALLLRRYYCKTDLWFLSYFVLGWKDIANPLHIEMCNILDRQDPFHWNGIDWMFVLPRDHLKSCLVTVADNIRDILRYPWIRIAIVSGKKDDAVEQFRKVRGELETNERLRKWWPDVLYWDPAREAQLWKEDELKVRFDGLCTGERHFYQAEPTLTALSVEGLRTGPHYDKAVFDDVVNRDNSQTPAMVEKTWENFSSVLCTLEPNCPLRIVGTFKAHNDTHARLYKRWQDERRRKLKSTIEVYIRGLKYAEDDEWPLPPGAEYGDYIFPQKFNDDAVERYRRGLPAKQFASEYEMNPIAPGEAKFDVADLRYYELLGRENGLWRFRVYARAPDGVLLDQKEVAVPLALYISSDFAIALNKRAAFTVISLIGVAPFDDWFVLHYVRERIPGIQAVDKMVALALANMPIKGVGFEAENIGKALAPLIYEEFSERCPGVSIYPIGQPHKTKEGRTEFELGARLKNHKIFISPSMWAAEDEVARFGTTGGTRDILDTWVNLAQIRQVPDIPRSETEDERKRREWREYILRETPGLQVRVVPPTTLEEDEIPADLETEFAEMFY